MNPVKTPSQKALAHMQSFRLWTEEERETSLQHTLAQLDELKDIWIFGYGSLIWRPEFEFLEERHATLLGYSRSLCLWSCVNRGTPELPGLVFGLKEGGVCEGKVYRLPNKDLMTQFRALWKREMPSDSYIASWLKCETEQGPVIALAFVMDQGTHAYAGDLTEEETLDIVLSASGNYGPCYEYVIETSDALHKAQIQDEHLAELSRLVKQRLEHKHNAVTE